MSTNEAMAAYWTEHAGPEWVQNEEMFDHELEPFGRAALEALAPTLGDSVLDIGCGFGTTSIDAARLVGPGGRVVGVDISPPMVQRAEERVGSLALRNVSFVVADAQVHRFDRPFDMAVSRFGVMFFADPVAAFANIHAVVRPGGRLAFVCWQAPEANRWALVAIDAWAPYLDEPAMMPRVGAPGPFGLADADLVRDVLARAGWQAVEVRAHHDEARLGGARGVDGALTQVMASSTGRALRDRLPVERRAAAMDDLRRLLEQHRRGDDVVFPAAAWVVTARR